MFRIYGKIFSFLKASFDYRGRCGRGDFWFFFLFYSLMFFAAYGADITYFERGVPSGLLLTLQDLCGGRPPFTPLYLLLFTPAMVAVTIRRLHDRGLSGFWAMLYALPFLGLIPMVIMLARPGMQRGNPYGAAPHPARPFTPFRDLVARYAAFRQRIAPLVSRLYRPNGQESAESRKLMAAE